MFNFGNKRNGFSLAEIMIVFIIIGIISMLALVTTKKMDHADKYLYSRAYDSLLTAAYNSIAEMDSNGMETPEMLCKGLTKFINSQPASNPKAGEEYKGGTDEGYCNNVTTRATKNTDDFKEIMPDFIANNGMKFYITEKIKEENIRDFENVASDLSFYLVYIDTDGDRGSGKVSDGNIIAFGVSENADVIPLGAPAYDLKFLAVRVIFPETKAHPEERASEAVTYYDAINKAWGHRISFDDLRTMDFNEFAVLKNTPILKNVKVPAERPAQLNECICDQAPKEEGGDGTDCLTTTLDVDKFDCDIIIQRYY